MLFKKLEVDFEVPELIQRDINGLQKEIEEGGSCIDCWQDEIRGSAHMCQGRCITYEQANLLINYYCNRSW